MYQAANIFDYNNSRLKLNALGKVEIKIPSSMNKLLYKPLGLFSKSRPIIRTLGDKREIKQFIRNPDDWFMRTTASGSHKERIGFVLLPTTISNTLENHNANEIFSDVDTVITVKQIKNTMQHNITPDKCQLLEEFASQNSGYRFETRTVVAPPENKVRLPELPCIFSDEVSAKYVDIVRFEGSDSSIAIPTMVTDSMLKIKLGKEERLYRSNIKENIDGDSLNSRIDSIDPIYNIYRLKGDDDLYYIPQVGRIAKKLTQGTGNPDSTGYDIYETDPQNEIWLHREGLCMQITGGTFINRLLVYPRNGSVIDLKSGSTWSIQNFKDLLPATMRYNPTKVFESVWSSIVLTFSTLANTTLSVDKPIYLAYPLDSRKDLTATTVQCVNVAITMNKDTGDLELKAIPYKSGSDIIIIKNTKCPVETVETQLSISAAKFRQFIRHTVTVKPTFPYLFKVGGPLETTAPTVNETNSNKSSIPEQKAPETPEDIVVSAGSPIKLETKHLRYPFKIQATTGYDLKMYLTCDKETNEPYQTINEVPGLRLTTIAINLIVPEEPLPKTIKNPFALYYDLLNSTKVDTRNILNMLKHENTHFRLKLGDVYSVEQITVKDISIQACNLIPIYQLSEDMSLDDFNNVYLPYINHLLELDSAISDDEPVMKLLTKPGQMTTPVYEIYKNEELIVAALEVFPFLKIMNPQIKFQKGVTADSALVTGLYASFYQHAQLQSFNKILLEFEDMKKMGGMGGVE